MKTNKYKLLALILLGILTSYSQNIKLDEANAVALSPDGKYVAGGGDKVIKIWEVATGKEIKTLLDLDSISFHSLVFLPDGKTLISGGDDVLWWNVEDGRKIRTFKTSIIYSIAVSPDGKTLAIPDKNYIKILDTANGKEKAILVGHEDEIRSVRFAPDGKRLLSSGKDRSVKIWSIAECSKLNISIERADEKEVTKTEISPDGKTVVSGGTSILRLWDIDSGSRKFEYDENYIKAIVFFPDGKTLVSADINGVIKLWDTNNGSFIKTLFESDSNGSIKDMVLSKDGKLLFFTSENDKAIKVIDTTSGKLIRTLN